MLDMGSKRTGKVGLGFGYPGDDVWEIISTTGECVQGRKTLLLYSIRIIEILRCFVVCLKLLDSVLFSVRAFAIHTDDYTMSKGVS